MALIDPEKNPSQRRRLDVPGEPGAWIEMRLATAGDIVVLQRDYRDVTPVERSLVMLSRCILAWSFDAPVTIQSLEALDAETYFWLDHVVQVSRSDDEKKDSNGSSSESSDPEEGNSPPSSGT